MLRAQGFTACMRRLRAAGCLPPPSPERVARRSSASVVVGAPASCATRSSTLEISPYAWDAHASGSASSSSQLDAAKASSTTAAVSGMTKRAPLYDTHGRLHNYLRISLTERCNLRCQYCMPAEGIDLTPSPNLLSTDELLRLTRLFAEMGVTKLRLTGGEPLVRKDIVDICRELGSLPGITKLAITTNGILLHRYIDAFVRAGVTGLNISLDTLQADRFMLITRRNGYNKVADSIALAEALPFESVKINCVVMRGVNDDEVGAFADMTRDRNLEVRFIEFMPFDDNKWARQKMFSMMETMDAIEKHTGKRLVHEARGETAQLFRLPGHRGRIGFIASMTTAFCSTCNRLRLTADGELKVCLFGEQEWSLRDAMRAGAADDELEALIRRALNAKHAEHGGKSSPEAIAASSNRPMIKIGG